MKLPASALGAPNRTQVVMEQVGTQSGIAANEAKFKTVDFALREIFRRDRVWQAKRRTASEAEAAKAAPVSAPPATPGPASTNPPSLPPPTPREPRPNSQAGRS